jgi:hypothetical protein
MTESPTVAALMDGSDNYVLELLKTASNGIADIEGEPDGRDQISFSERVALLNALTRYLQIRHGLADPASETDQVAEIDSYVDELKRKRAGRKAGGRTASAA